MLQGLVSDRRIHAVMVEGVPTPFYCRSEDVPLLEAVLEGRADLKPRMSFLAPLDPLLWDKALVLALWNFSYSWEIYTPAAKRQFGWYTLPILYGDRFVGRVEAASDRKAGILQVKGLWWEPGIRRTKTLDAALERALRRLAAFNDCPEVRRVP